MTTETPGAEWLRLCKEWKEKQRAYFAFPIAENGWMYPDRLAEWNRLGAAVQEVRDRMDAFIANHP